MTTTQVIHLYRGAPAKPDWMMPCNGCGVCCATETCPVGRVLFWQRRGPCPALTWQDGSGRYQCGLVSAPHEHLRGLPSFLSALASRCFLRWIAAGKGCDCSFIMATEAED